jgi:putative flippase GtrA
MSQFSASGDGRKGRVKSLIVRFVKFNIVGFVAFLAGTSIYLGLFGVLGIWSYFVASASGGVLQFVLINYLNTKKRGRMFNSYDAKHEETQPKP